MTKTHLYKQVKDEILRQKLESRDVFGCKRPLMLDNYFPIFTKDNVELITDSVTGLTENSIISKNSETGEETERKTDVLIWGTGKFEVDMEIPEGQNLQLLTNHQVTSQ